MSSPPAHPDPRRSVVLASGSVHRRRLLEEVGFEVEVDPPGIDERAADPVLLRHGPEALALELARRKAAAVIPRHPGAVVLAADQLGVLADGTTMLAKQSDHAGAVAQLMSMSGTTHRLVNGLVLVDTAGGRAVEGVDVVAVTMRSFDEDEAASYVRRFEPWDSAGSYRIEDQEELAAVPEDTGGPFVEAVTGERSAVIGLPLGLLDELWDRL